MDIQLHPDQPTKPLGDLFGIFIEDLNHALDGGLYAELVQNRDFEFDPIDHPDYNALTGWTLLGDAEAQVENEGAPFPENPHFVRVRCTAGSGIAAEGYHGIPTRQGKPCRLRMWARGEKGTVLYVSMGGAKKAFALYDTWTCHEADLTPLFTSGEEMLRITSASPGEFCLAYVSLMPCDHIMGFRRDLYEALADLKPRFIRFPGGCLTHDGVLDPQARNGIYNWKNTVGPLERRPGKRNSWRYHQTFGIGFYEFFCLCESLGAQPLPVLSGGCNPHARLFATGEALQRYIQDALDLIDFAKGSPDTHWGGVRAAMGHPEPFELTYLAIGNEEVHQEFFDRLPLFVRAIREKDPSIRLIGTAGPFAAGGEYERGWRCAREIGIDLVDEHYYQGPDWYYANPEHYSHVDPKGPKVFLGEYASWGNRMENALAEAAYMTHLQTAPAVGLACYAPLLSHARYTNWRPDLIWFDNRRVSKTPNYYVQQLFMRDQGDEAIAMEVTGNEPGVPLGRPIAGEIRLEPDNVRMEITHQVLTTSSGAVYPEDCLLTGHTSRLVAKAEGDFTYTLRVRRLSGEKGLHVHFGFLSDQDRWQWCFGGWENQDTLVEKRDRGLNTCLTQTEFSVADGVTYELCLKVEGRRIRTFIDGVLMNDVTDHLPRLSPLYLAASRDMPAGTIILKAVNPHGQAQDAAIHWGRHGLCQAVCLHGQPDDENTLDHPDAVKPWEEEREVASSFTWRFAPHSVTVLRLLSS